jgi:hypothetical protein
MSGSRRPKLHFGRLGAYDSPADYRTVYAAAIGGHARGRQIINVQILAIQVGGDVPGHLAPFQFVKISGNHPAMDLVAALGVDRVRNISVQFQAAMAVSVLIAHEAVFVEAIAAIRAIAGAKVIFLTAAPAVIAQFTRGHGEKQPVIAIDQLYVANYECMIKGEGAKGLQPTGLSIAQFYAHFREQHKNPCCETPR